MSERIFLGVDGGATKTHALLVNGEGVILGFGAGGPANHEVVGFDRAREEIGTAVSRALEGGGLPLSQIEKCCFCLAGADVSSDFVEIPEKILRPIVGEVSFDLKNDAFGCLRGGTRDPYGVMINCGTGQVAAGRNRKGEEIRLGGYGFEYGDLTGGSVITFQAVTAIVRAFDGRGEQTSLTERILEAAGCPDVPTFIDKTYRDEEFLHSLQIPQITFRASREGDACARRIILGAAEEMSITATALIRRLGMTDEEFDLIAAGSVFKGEDPVFMETIENSVRRTAPRARFRKPLYEPVVGAALLAAEASGIEITESFYQNLEKTLTCAVPE